jgi:hypothetical protein
MEKVCRALWHGLCCNRREISETFCFESVVDGVKPSVRAWAFLEKTNCPKLGAQASCLRLRGHDVEAGRMPALPAIGYNLEEEK